MLVALLVPAEWDPQYYELDATRDMLSTADISIDPVAWNAVSDDRLAGVDGILPLIAWGYHLDPVAWFGLLDRVEQRGLACANPVPVLRWSSDKRYLIELEQAGVAIVPTMVGAASQGPAMLDEARELFGCDELILKPVVGASAEATYRLTPGDAFPDALGDRAMLVQPFISQILDQGEYSLVYFDGKFSHAAVKRAKPGDFRVQPEFGGSEEEIEPTAAMRDLAESALACAPAETAYARIDIVMDGDTPRIMELELVEPDLFLRYAPGGGKAFASAIAKMLGATGP